MDVERNVPREGHASMIASLRGGPAEEVAQDCPMLAAVSAPCAVPPRRG